MRVNARKTVNAFLAGKATAAGTIWTDGQTVYSYAMPIARRVKRTVFHPRTTSSHMFAMVRGVDGPVVDKLPEIA